VLVSGEGPAEGAGAPALRASDAERERTATLLRDHAGAGRLTPEELSDRLDVAYAARTVAELDALVADLPPAAEPAPPGRSPEHDRARRRVLQAVGFLVLVNLVALGVWLASGSEGSFWPGWFLLVSGIRLAFLAWGELGPAAAHRDEAHLGRGGARRLERERQREQLRSQLREERALRRSRRRS
jgi:uncharacterized protein DUF1707